MIEDPQITDLAPAICDSIQRSTHVVLTCHVAPDGDAIGSTTALCAILHRLGKHVDIIAPDELPPILLAIPGARYVKAFSKEKTMYTDIINKADLIFALDYNEPKRVDRMVNALLEAPATKIMIDHHLHPDAFCDITISRPHYAATCALLYDVLEACGYTQLITPDIATSLLAGIMTDTGNFAYNVSDPHLFEIVAKVMSAGANHTAMYKAFFNTETLNRMRLNAFALYKRLQVWPEFGTALIALSRDEYNNFHYQKGDTEGLVNKPLAIPGITCSAFLREEDGYVHVSMRSVGDIYVNRICTDYFNGGGHRNAAGGEITISLDDARNLFKSILPLIPTKYSSQS